MFNKLKLLISLLKEGPELENNLRIMKMSLLCDIEEFIRKQDKKRKESMDINDLAKEVLFMDEDYYIISAEELKEYITRKL